MSAMVGFSRRLLQLHVPWCGGVVDSTLTPVDLLSNFDTVEPPSLKQPCSFLVDVKQYFNH